MTREEAIQKAERALNDPIAKGGGVALLELDHLRVLLEVLRVELDTTTTSWYSKKLYCDACGGRIIGEKYNYCPMCGRKLGADE